MNKKNIMSLTLLLVLLGSGYTAIGSGVYETWVVPNQDHMIVESISDPESVDPAWAYDTDSEELILNVYETLVYFDYEKMDQFLPHLATEWLINQPPHPNSPAGTYSTWYFKIRENVKFHDGSILTTEDVEYSFKRLMVMDRFGGPAWMIYEPLLGRQHADMSWPEAAGNPIDAAVERNSTHVWFNLVMPYPPFMQILSQPWSSIVSKAFSVAHGDWNGDWTNWKAYHDPEISPLDAAGNVMSGTGPYMLDYWTHGIEWSVVKFDEYWQGWPAPHSSSYVSRATVKTVYEWGTRYADFIGGLADMVYVPRAYLPQMIMNWPTKWNPGDITNPEEYAEGMRCLPGLPTLAMDAFFFTFDTNPASGYVGTGSFPDGIPLDFFSDVRIRQAFAYSFDYEEFLATQFWGEAVQPKSCVPEGILYHNPANPTYSLDYEMARDLFQVASADPASPAYGVWTSGFTMTITYNIGNIARETTAEMLRDGIQHVFSTYGGGPVTINVLGVPWPTYLGELVGYPTFKSLMPIFIIGWLADYPDAHDFVKPFMHSQGTLASPASYSNSTVDALIAEGIATPDGPARQAIYYTLQLMYYQDVPSVCTSQALGRHWERKWVQGWYYNPLCGGSLSVGIDSTAPASPVLYFYHLWKGIDADLNGDHIVDALDEAILLSHWYNPPMPPGPLGYDRIADIYPELAPDGLVNILDKALMNSQWGDIKIERPPVTSVTIDIKPDSYPNSICLEDQGQLPVAIFGSAAFDVETIDPITLQLGGVDISTRGSAKAPKIAYSIEDIDGDGNLDMMAFFSVSDLVTIGALTSTTTELELTGTLLDGTLIAGTDEVNVVPPT